MSRVDLTFEIGVCDMLLGIRGKFLGRRWFLVVWGLWAIFFSVYGSGWLMRECRRFLAWSPLSTFHVFHSCWSLWQGNWVQCEQFSWFLWVAHFLIQQCRQSRDTRGPWQPSHTRSCGVMVWFFVGHVSSSCMCFWVSFVCVAV